MIDEARRGRYYVNLGMRASRKLVLALSTAEQRAAEARDRLRWLKVNRADVASRYEATGEVRAWEEAVEMLKALQ